LTRDRAFTCETYGFDSYPIGVYTCSMEIIEIPHFTDILHKFQTDDEYAALQWFLVLQPTAGNIVAGCSGVRKVRWSSRHQGRRGGLRVIYLHLPRKQQIWMLTIYAKVDKKDLTRNDKKVLKQIIQEIKR
jgi:hypothetical protein